MKKSLLLGASIAVIALSSCKNSDFDGYTKAENGLHYKFYVHNENGLKPVVGDGVAFRYVIKKESNDSVLVDSKTVSRDGSGITKFQIPKSSFSGSIEDALMMMAKGDSASFIVSADSFFLKTQRAQSLPPHLKPGDHLIVTIKVADVVTKKEIDELQKKQQAEMEKEMQKKQAEEKPALEKYLADNKITTKPTASGLIYIETKKGSGPNPKPTDSVTVHYKGTFLDGKVFDSSIERGQPITFPLNGVIPGWIEGMQLMKKGGKATLIIPSNLAYGQGNQGIPPYSTLLFEVELIDIKSK